MVYRQDNKKWQLPDVLSFFNDRKFYDVERYGKPKKGEWFLSGAIPAAYFAKNDMSTEYLIVKPTLKAIQKHVWVPVDNEGNIPDDLYSGYCSYKINGMCLQQ